jgi:glycine oxidase
VRLIVVGGGLIGCAIARYAARAGAEVTVLDPDAPGQHASWAAAGMLAPQAEAEANDDFLSLLLRGRALYPTIARELAEETGINVLYRTEGSLLLAMTAEDELSLNTRYNWQSRAGLPVERILAEDIRRLEPSVSPDVRAGLFFPGDHQVENRLLCEAFCQSATKAGATFIRSSVAEVLTSPNLGVRADSGEVIPGDAVVIAAGSWSGSIDGLPRAIPVEPILGQLVSYKASSTLLSHVVVTNRGYVVPRSDGRLIAGATVERAGFELRTTEEGKERVRRHAEEMVPLLAAMRVAEHWAGLRPATPDRLPILGRDPEVEGLFYATGHFRNGVLLAPISGEVIGRMVMGAPPGLNLQPFRVDRFTGEE